MRQGLLFLLFAISFAICMLFSIQITNNIPQSAVLGIPLPQFESGQDAKLVIDLNPYKLLISAPQAAKAKTEDQWLFVRQSATWANSNSTVVDKIITSLKNNGLLAKTGTTNKTDLVINNVTYKMKVESGTCSSCNSVSSTAYTGTRSFKNRFKIWRASDNKQALELLFDDPDTISANGILLNYRIGVISKENSNNEDLIVESYIFGQKPSRKQSYTWNGAFWIAPSSKASTTSNAGRVVLEEMTFGLVGGGVVSGLGARIVAKTVSQTTACGTGEHYFTLAYMQKTDSNFETTALEGLAVNAFPSTSTLCGFDIVKFGLFNGNGFVKDNIPATEVSTGFPDPGVTYGVQAEFDKIGKAPNGSGTYDDLTRTAIDSSRPAFRTANDPP